VAAIEPPSTGTLRTVAKDVFRPYSESLLAISVSRGRSGTEGGGSMTEDGMREAVVTLLVQRPASTDRNDQGGRRGWSSSIRHGGGPGADSATIEFVKTKSFSTCQLHEVDFINHKGWTMHELVKTWQEKDGGWKVHRLGGGAGPHPYRTHPWVNFCAGFGPESFTGGGHVVGDGAEKARSVQLLFANDIGIEDTIDNGVVLFFEPRAVVAPVDVSVVDGDGATLVSYREFEGLAPSS
jgi:hypothetical protein